MSEPLHIGQIVEIRPGYNAETSCRDVWDEIAGCEAEVVALPAGTDVLVHVKGQGETFVNARRLKLR
jgi:hypothetical protein